MDHGSGLERQAAPVGRLLFGPRRGLGATCSTKAAQHARKGCVTCGFGAPRCVEASPLQFSTTARYFQKYCVCGAKFRKLKKTRFQIRNSPQGQQPVRGARK